MKYYFLMFTIFGNLHADDSLDSKYGQLVFVSSIFRHGDRTPLETYETDPYNETYWPEGYGQLTKEGKLRLYEMGKWFRKRYYKILGQVYNQKTIYVLSSDIDRVIMSAQCFLAGLYPPSESEMWTSDFINWQPIPIHTIPIKLDNLLHITARCDLLSQTEFVVGQSRFLNYYLQHEDNIEYVSKHSLIDVSRDYVYQSLLALITLFDTLLIEECHNLTLPSWTDPVIPDVMSEFGYAFLEARFYTKIQQRLYMGELLKSIVHNMTNKIDGKLEPETTLMIYSAQEHNIMGLLKVFEIYYPHFVIYAANIIIELRVKENDYNVLVFYKNTTVGEPYLMDLPKCPYPCYIDKFINSIEEYIPENWQMECRVQEQPVQSPSASLESRHVLHVILLLICVFIIIWICFRCLKKNTRIYGYAI